MEEEGEFEGVVVTPLGGFAVGLVGGRLVVPCVGVVVDGMKEETLVGGVRGKVRLIEEGVGDCEGGGVVLGGGFGLIVGGEVIGKTEEALGGDCGGGGVDGFGGIAGIGRGIGVIGRVGYVGRPCVPVDHAI